MPLWVFGLLGSVRKAIAALFGMMRRNPMAAMLVASLCLSIWLWRAGERARGERDVAIAGRADDRARYTAAQVEAARVALAAKAATEARYRANAERTQNAYETELADARDATADYIRTHRVRVTSVAGSPGPTASSPGDRSAESGERSGTAPFMVAVSENEDRKSVV